LLTLERALKSEPNGRVGHKTDIAGNGDVPLRVIWEPTKATAGEHCNGGIIDGMVAGIGPRWLEVERAMGIEYTAWY
jgi:hypothetical protein